TTLSSNVRQSQTSAPMGWTPLRRHLCAKVAVSRTATRGETSMENVSIVGLDLAKNVFQAHGARRDGTVAFREKISRAKLITFFSSIPKCMVAMEACGAAHHWAREIGALGHEVRLIAPIYVKPFVKRNKNDAADAEAIAEAASRPTMRFVAVKTVEKQAAGVAFKTRDLLVRQRTQTINAVRGHMAEYGVVAPNGPVHVARLVDAMHDQKAACQLPSWAFVGCCLTTLQPLLARSGCWKKNSASGRGPTRPRAG